MSRTVVVLLVSVLGLSIAAVTLLLALGKDASTLIQLLATLIIPGVISLVTLQRVEKTRDAAETVVQQTNGRMTELIENNRELAERVALLSGALEPETFSELPVLDTPDVAHNTSPYDVDENGKPYLRRL